MRIKSDRRTRLIVVVALTVAGCSSGGVVDPAQLTGTWVATKIEATSKANPSVVVDGVQVGVAATLTINSNGRYAGFYSLQGSPGGSSVGSVTVLQDTIVFNDDAYPVDVSVGFVLSGSVLTLSGDAAYDFDQDRRRDSASVVVVLRRS